MTTATVLCAATDGGVRGRGVLAWDDNELRGTLGLRAGSARHARTIRHLIRDTGRWPEDELGVPICQEDLLLAHLTFSYLFATIASPCPEPPSTIPLLSESCDTA